MNYVYISYKRISMLELTDSLFMTYSINRMCLYQYTLAPVVLWSIVKFALQSIIVTLLWWDFSKYTGITKLLVALSVPVATTYPL